VSPFLPSRVYASGGYSPSTFGGYALCLVADVQWSPPMVNGEVGEVLRGAHVRASSRLGCEHHPADRACSSRSTVTIPNLETPTTITSTSSFTCSPTPCLVLKRTRLAFRSLLASRVQITPARSPAAVAASLRSTEFFGLAEPPSLTLRRYVQEADGRTERLDRVAHPGVTRYHRPSLRLNILIGS
jgi:hypothetical protein